MARTIRPTPARRNPGGRIHAIVTIRGDASGAAVECIVCLAFMPLLGVIKLAPVNRKMLMGCTVALMLCAYLALELKTEYLRVSSPDGRHYASVTVAKWKTWIPMMAGQSGDKSGYVTIFTKEGRSCGRVPLEMVSFIHDLRWASNRAEIPLVAEWDLARHAVHRLR